MNLWKNAAILLLNFYGKITTMQDQLTQDCNELKTFCTDYASKNWEIESEYHGGQSTTIAELLLSRESKNIFFSPYKSFVGNVDENHLPQVKLYQLLNHGSITNTSTEYQSNVIPIIGIAGTGKSTLCKSLLRDYARNETDFEFMFYINLCNVDCEEKCNLLSFLTKSYNGQCMYMKKRRDEVLSKLSRSSICVILDGLDRVDISEYIDVSETELCNECEVGAFIKALINRKILQLTKIVVTSRPLNFYQLPSNIRPKNETHVWGLEQTSLRSLCQAIYKDTHIDIMMIISSDSDLLNFCRVPLHFIYVMHVVNDFLVEHKDEQYLSSFSVTNILAATLILLLHHHKIKNKQNLVVSLASLAWNSLSENKLKFDREDFDDVEEVLNKTKDSMLISSCDANDEPPQCKFCFHVIFQNFLSALHLVLKNGFAESLQILCEHKLNSSITMFLAGFANNYTTNYLKILIPKNQIQKFFQSEDKGLIDIADKEWFHLTNLEVIELMLERKDKCEQKYAKLFKRPVVYPDHYGTWIEGDIFPFDLIRLLYVMRNVEADNWILSVCGTFCIGSLKWLSMIGEIHKIQSNLQSNYLIIANRALNDHEVAGVAHTVAYFRNIKFNYNNEFEYLNFTGIKRLALAINEKWIESLEIRCISKEVATKVYGILMLVCKKYMRLLKVYPGFGGIFDERDVLVYKHENKYKDEILSMVYFDSWSESREIPQKKLKLESKIKPGYKDFLFSQSLKMSLTTSPLPSIQYKSSKSSFFSLKNKKLIEHGFGPNTWMKEVVDLINNVNDLSMEKCFIQGDAKATIQYKSKKLELIEVHFDSWEWTSQLAEIIKLNNIVDDLSIENCYVKGVEKGKIQFKSKKLELIEVHFDSSKWTSQLVKLVELNNIVDDLSMENCYVKGDEKGKIQFKMSELQLIEADFQYYVWIDQVVDFINNVKDFSMENCHIKYVNAKIHYKMRFFDISGVDIGDDGCIKIASCISNVDQLKIGSWNDRNLTIKGIKALCSSICGLSKPMRLLDIRGFDIGDDGVIEIASCVGNIEELMIGSWNDQNLTMKGIKTLSKSIHKLAKPMKCLGLRYGHFFFGLDWKEVKEEFDRCRSNLLGLQFGNQTQ